MPGRRRTGSSPSSTSISRAAYPASPGAGAALRASFGVRRRPEVAAPNRSGALAVFLAVFAIARFAGWERISCPRLCHGGGGIVTSGRWRGGVQDAKDQIPSKASPAMFEEYAKLLVDFVREHQAWAAPIVFALAFAESLAFISLLVPAWGALVLIGGMIQAGGLNFWPIWVAGSIGAALGDWLSYWIGQKLEHRVQHIWPLSSHPELIPKGEAFIKKWGVLGIFIARFSGPLRASVPLVAGIFEMPFWRFQVANFVSAFIWAATLLLLGDVVSQALQLIWK